MIEISKQNHATVVNASLKKLYNQARIKGKLESVDLYIFNVLYHLVNECDFTLTREQIRKLECIYRILYNTSKDICKINNLQRTKFQRPRRFIVPSPGTAIPPVIAKVYYWQEPTPFTEFTDIQDAILNDNYLDDKPSVTKTEFEFGVDVPLVNIGRIVFVFNPSDLASTFIIKDVLNNDVTHAFTKVSLESINMMMFVSEQVYAYGSLKLSAIETPGELAKIYNNVFNNTFA